MNIANNLWVEKYRPKTLDEIVLDDKTKEFVKITLFDYITDTEKRKDIKDLKKIILSCEKEKISKVCELSTELLSQKMQRYIF